MDLVDLIKNATKVSNVKTSSQGIFDIDEKLLKEIKRRCKDNTGNIDEVARYLLLNLSSNKGIIRMKSLIIMDELFNRSNLFRLSVCKGLKTITSCAGFLQVATNNSINDASNSSSVATSANEPMKLAKDYNEEIQNKVKELIELWDIRYGSDYTELHAMARYLRESLKIRMPNICKKAKEHEERSKEIEKINKNKLILRKNKILKNELHDGIVDVETTLQVLALLSPFYSLAYYSLKSKGIDSCFSIIFPSVVAPTEKMNTNKPEKRKNKKRTIWECDGIELPVEECGDDADNTNHVVEPVSDNFSDVEWESDDEISNQNTIVAGATPFTITIPIVQHVSEIESRDNKIVFDTLREHKNHLQSILLPKLLEWQEVLSSTCDLLPAYTSEEEKNEHYEGLKALNQIVLTCQGVLRGRLRLLD